MERVSAQQYINKQSTVKTLTQSTINLKAIVH